MSDIPIYTQEQIAKIRVACDIAQQVLVYIEPFVKAGVTTGELDRLCHKFIEDQGCIPAPLGYHGYPKATCISINEVICHGIPDETTKLRDNDIVNIDITVIKDGYYGDNSKTYIVGGKTYERAQLLVDKTQEALYAAIRVCKPGARFSDIGDAIAKVVTPHSFSIVRDFVGHGVGAEFHHEPNVLHYPNGDHRLMQPGMVFTIEPMINAGTWKQRTLKDGWTAVTRDGKNSAQFEHQLLITETGCEVLTIRAEEEAAGKITRFMENIKNL